MSGSLSKKNFFVQWNENALYFEWRKHYPWAYSLFFPPDNKSPTFRSGCFIRLDFDTNWFDILLCHFPLINLDEMLSKRDVRLTLQDANNLYLDEDSFTYAFIKKGKETSDLYKLCVRVQMKTSVNHIYGFTCAFNCQETLTETWGDYLSNIFKDNSDSAEKVLLLEEPTLDSTNSVLLNKNFKCTADCVASNRFLQFSSDFKKILDQSISTDIVLKVEEKSIKAHKLILQTRSPVFLKVFNHNTCEASENVVNITDISPEAIKKFVGFLYTGTMEECSFEETLEIYYAADKYEVLSLREECVPKLVKNLEVNNACSLFALASRHGDADLKEAVVKFASPNFVAVIETESFVELNKDDMKTFTRLCSGAKKK